MKTTINRLSKHFGIPSPRLVITNNPMLMRNKLGMYNPASKTIYIRPNMGEDVLLHEYCHFLDYEYFKKTESPHTREFFERVIELTKIKKENI